MIKLSSLLGALVKTNFVLIDYENVQPADLSPLKGGTYEVRLFIGANQKSLKKNIVLSMQEMGERAQYIEVNEIRDNAVDFHIAYYIGNISSAIKDVCFHIISKDKGYDPLINHLNQKKLADCKRFERLEDIPRLVTVSKAKPDVTESKKKLDINIDIIIDKLKNMKGSRPGKLKALRSTISSWSGKKLSDDDFSNIVNQLWNKKIIKETAGNITYTFAD